MRIYALAGLYLLLDSLASREINIDKDTDYLISKLFESNVPKKRATMKLGGLTLEVIDDK